MGHSYTNSSIIPKRCRRQSALAAPPNTWPNTRTPPSTLAESSAVMQMSLSTGDIRNAIHAVPMKRNHHPVTVGAATSSYMPPARCSPPLPAGVIGKHKFPDVRACMRPTKCMHCAEHAFESDACRAPLECTQSLILMQRASATWHHSVTPQRL